MRTLLVSVLLLVGCGPQTVALKSAVYSFEGLRGREGTPSAIVWCSSSSGGAASFVVGSMNSTSQRSAVEPLAGTPT